MKAFVAGATGETGRRIVAQLVERQIPVRALVRNPEKAAEILPAGVMIPNAEILRRKTRARAVEEGVHTSCGV